MLWQCQFKWHPSTTGQQVRRRILEQHDAGANHPERIKGWYGDVGGGSGFLLVESDEPREVSAFLTPYRDLMEFEVHGVFEVSYDAAIQGLRQSEQLAPV